jgi:hypothetical protein
MKRIKLLLAALTLLFAGWSSLALPAAVHAATPKQTVCTTIGGGSDCTTQPTNGVKLNNIVTAVIRILSGLIGVIAVIMVMYSGFKYITAAGDSSKAASAKSTLVYAIIGLVIAFMAQLIVKFVLDKIK